MYYNKYSNFWRRFFAILIDGLVFLPVQWIDTYMLSGAISSGGVFAWGIVSSVLGVLYYVLMHAKFGQTIGKMVTKVKVVDLSETRNLTIKQSCMRDIVPIILLPFSFYAYAQLSFYQQTWDNLEQSTIFVYIGYAVLLWALLECISMLFNHKRRAIHDYFAGSVVVRKT